MEHLKTKMAAIGIAAFLSLPLSNLLGSGGQNVLEDSVEVPKTIASVQSNALLPIVSPETPAHVNEVLNVVITAYSSTPWQTDDTPFITASGNWVRSGIVATNLLPFGTKIRIPDVYGERVFVVDDRMHPTKLRHVDIWFPTYWEAKKFGAKYTHIEVLES